MNHRPARPTWLPLVTALLTGLFLGLLIGWVLWPVEWTDALLDELRPDLRAQYISAVADAYAASGGQDWALALERLQTLSDPQAAIQEAIRYYEVSDRADRNIRIVNLRMLAELVATASPAPGAAQALAQSGGIPWWRRVLIGLFALLGLGMAGAGVLLLVHRWSWLAERLARPRPGGPAPSPARAPSPDTSTPETERSAPWIVSPGVTPSPAPATSDVDAESDWLSEEARQARWQQMIRGTAGSTEGATAPTEPEDEGEEPQTARPPEDALDIDVDRPTGSFWEPVERIPASSRPRPPKGTPLYPDLGPGQEARDEETDADLGDETDDETAQDGPDWDEPEFPATHDRASSADRPRVPGPSTPRTDDVDEMSGHNEPWERMDPSADHPRNLRSATRRTDRPQDMLRIPHRPGVRSRPTPSAGTPPAVSSPRQAPSPQAAPRQDMPSQAEQSPPEGTPLRGITRRLQGVAETLLGREAETEETLLLEREVAYRWGQHDLEESYPLEIEGELLGYCGVGSPEAVKDQMGPRAVHILHVWLYDLQSDERVHLPLISPGLDADQARLLDEGHDLAPDDSRAYSPVELRPGARFELTTAHLRLEGTVEEATVRPPREEPGAPLQTVHLRLQVWHLP